MHAANRFPMHRRASTLLTGALGTCRAARSGTQAEHTKRFTFGRAHGVDDGSLKARAGLRGLAEVRAIACDRRTYPFEDLGFQSR